MFKKRGLFTGTTGFVLIFVMAVLWLPWLADTPFYSKGEPREAIVAMSMLESGDWILPINGGEEIPFKPPFLAWMIAVFAWVFNGGVVNEFIARLPSVLAAMAMVMGGYVWAKKARGKQFAFIMSMVTITSFEVFRAAEACRVDMVLTAAMVGAIYILYEIRERRGRDNVGLWASAAALLTVATLTKGPVGALLPCLAVGIYLLVRKDNFFKTVGKLAVLCFVSFLLPALWYYAAWKRGGMDFVDMALEENIGRLTGTMTYDSHVKPFWYNFLTILAGMMPWTIYAFLCSLRAQTYHKWPFKESAQLALTAALTVIVFYCIPVSKRSVYLLPAYPFIAYGVTALIKELSGTGVNRFFGRMMAFLGIVAPIVVGILAAIPDNPFVPGFHLAHWWEWGVLAVPVIISLWWISGQTASEVAMPVVWALLFAYNGAIMPSIFAEPLKAQQTRDMFEDLASDSTTAFAYGTEKKISTYWYNFYMADRLHRLHPGPQVDSLAVGTRLVISYDPDTLSLDRDEWQITNFGFNPDTRRDAYLATRIKPATPKKAAKVAPAAKVAKEAKNTAPAKTVVPAKADTIAQPASTAPVESDYSDILP